jgi:hypothetical protein
MTRDRSTSRPLGPAAATALLATALLATGGAGGAVLAGCTSNSDRPPSASSAQSSSSASPETSWSVATPDPSRDGSATPGPTGPAPATSGGEGGGDASGDGVERSIAALPASSRIRQVPRGASGTTRAPADGGIWMISRPDGAPGDYAEVLRLDASGTRIERAYPFPHLAPQWLLVTSRAVYCGRGGDAVAPDTMVCRIDRSTGELRVRVAADLEDEATVTEEHLSKAPGTWVVDDRNFVADFGTVPAVGMELTFRSGSARLRLSPDTLGVLGS